MLSKIFFMLCIIGTSSLRVEKGARCAPKRKAHAYWNEGAILRSQGQLTNPSVDEPAAEDKCYQFSIGSPEKMELYSPNYPRLYPNHTDCVRVIEANVGHTLKLDFRDQFFVELSEDCKFDYLEVRDGGHGYDRLLGKWCGDNYPPVIESTSRWLWLRFKSDENIECSGFRAVWEEVPIPESKTEVPELSCFKPLAGVEGFLNRSDIETEFEDSAKKYGKLECMWKIEVDQGWRIQLQFIKFALAVPNDCETNFVDIFPENTDLPSRLQNFCGSIAETIQSKGPVLQVRFVALTAGLTSDFVAMYTAFRDKVKSAEPVECESNEFDCEDATCISLDLKCNGRINCRFPTDEDPARCQLKEGLLTVMLNTEHMVIILVVFFLILTGMCCAFLYNCFSKLVRDHRIIREQMRASREVGLDSPNLWQTRADSPETRESECQTRESVFSDIGSLRPASVESTKSAPDVIISH